MKNILKRVLKIGLSNLYFLFKKAFLQEIKIKGDVYSNVFFGYYDVSPFSFDDTKLIMQGERDDGIVDILLYDLQSKTHKVLGSTRAWNYQQGARLMWYSEDTVIYNSYDTISKSFCAVLKNIETLNERKQDIPIQALFKKKFFLSIDYYELHQLGTEYGYNSVTNNSNFGKIFRYDFERNESHLLFKTEDCLKLLKKTYSETESVHANHFLINPTGEYFVFILRFYVEGKRVDSLMGFDFLTNQPEVLIEGEIISHFTWQKDHHILFWGVLNKKSGYFIFDVTSKKIECVLSSNRDGHPTVIGSNSFISDTYPNLFSSQVLYSYDMAKEQKTILAEVKHPVSYDKDRRCDLHPSLSRNKELVQIDFMNKKRRSVGILKLRRE